MAAFTWKIAPMALALCAASAAGADMAATTSCAHTLGPASKRDALLAQPEAFYRFVVRGTPAAIAAAAALARTDTAANKPESLEAFDSAVLTLQVRNAARVCALQGIDQVWYLHPRLADPYTRVLLGLQYVYRSPELVRIVNMSLGPPQDAYPMPPDPDEPMHYATRKLADRGSVVIMAIGNFGPDAAPGMTNPWCHAPWVMCVGAATADGRTLWPQSSRGLRDDRPSWPTVVADGVDVVGPRASTPKTAQQRARDESNSVFMAAVLADRRDDYTLMSGSSQAAAQVSRAAAQIAFFIEQQVKRDKRRYGDYLFQIPIPHEHFEFAKRLGERITGTVVTQNDAVVEISYRVVKPWRLVKQLLMDTAFSMPGLGPDEVGAGFVSPEHVEALFGQFGIAGKRLMAVKVE